MDHISRPSLPDRRGWTSGLIRFAVCNSEQKIVATRKVKFCSILIDCIDTLRATTFSFLEACGYIASPLGPLVIVGTAEMHPLVPVSIASICFLLALALSMFLDGGPHGQPLSLFYKTFDSENQEHQPLLRGDSQSIASHATISSRKGGTAVLSDFRVLVLLTAFSVMAVSRGSLPFFLPYVSRRFGWSISKAGILQTINDAASLLLYILIIPGGAMILGRYMKISSRLQNVLLAQWSLSMLACGNVVIALAPTITVLVLGATITALGFGVSLGLRVLLSLLIPSSQFGRLYTTIAACEIIGKLAGLPIMGAVFARSKNPETWKAGLPFILSAICYGTVILLICGVIPTLKNDMVEDDLDVSNADINAVPNTEHDCSSLP